MEFIRKDTAGYEISLVLKSRDGSEPLSLTNATVTIYLYSIGNDTAAWNHEATVDDATNGLASYDTISTDWDTVGDYYSVIDISYTGGNQLYRTGESYKVIDNQENLVTVNEFLEYIQIPSENAFPNTVIETYLNDAEDQVNLDFSGLATTTNEKYISLKQRLIKMQAAIQYFMNMNEGAVNPDVRIQKIRLWNESYNNLKDKFAAGIGDTDTTDGSGIVRRVEHSDYSDEDSYLYEG